MVFRARMRARWQRLKRCRCVPTLISPSRCTRWCIDCCADQLDALFCGEPNELNFVERQTQRACQAQNPHIDSSLLFSFKETFYLPSCCLFFSEMLSVTVLKVLCERRWQQLRGCLYSVAPPLNFGNQLIKMVPRLGKKWSQMRRRRNHVEAAVVSSGTVCCVSRCREPKTNILRFWQLVKVNYRAWKRLQMSQFLFLVCSSLLCCNKSCF